MEFMSQEHIDAMNVLLVNSEKVLTAAKELPREYVLAYELTAGPVDGATVYWQVRLGPAGTVFELAPAENPDLCFRGEWRSVVESAARSRDGASDDGGGMSAEGDVPSFMAAVGKNFAIAREVATVPVTYPV
jgi:hypothetical protein